MTDNGTEDRVEKGFFYIMTNPAQLGLVLIGTSSRHPEERLLDDDMNGPGVPLPYEIRYYALVSDMKAAMDYVHGRLISAHVDKQFYETTTGMAVDAVESANVEILFRETDVSVHEISKAGRRPEPARLSRGQHRPDTPYSTSLREQRELKKRALNRMLSDAPDAEINTPAPTAPPAAANSPAVANASTSSSPSPKRTEPMLVSVGGTGGSASPAFDRNAVRNLERQGDLDIAPVANRQAAVEQEKERFFQPEPASKPAAVEPAPAPAEKPRPVSAEEPTPVKSELKRSPAESETEAPRQTKTAKPPKKAARKNKQKKQAAAKKKANKQSNGTKPASNDKKLADKAGHKKSAADKPAAPIGDNSNGAAPATNGASAPKLNGQGQTDPAKPDRAQTNTSKHPQVDVNPTVSPTPKRELEPGAPLPIPSLSKRTGQEMQPAPQTQPAPTQASANPNQPVPQTVAPAGIVYGPQGPVALHPIPGTPYMAVTPVQMAPGENGAPNQPIVHTVQGPDGITTPAPTGIATMANGATNPGGHGAGVLPAPGQQSMAGPGMMPPGVAAPGAGAAPNDPAQLEAWLSEQDNVADRRKRNRRAILWSLVGIPIGGIAGGAYVVLNEGLPTNMIGAIIGGAVVAGMVVFYLLGRLLGGKKSNDFDEPMDDLSQRRVDPTLD